MSERGPAVFAAADDESVDAVRQALGALSALLPLGLFAAAPDGACWFANQRLLDALGVEPRHRGDRPIELRRPADDKGQWLILPLPGRVSDPTGADSLRAEAMPIIAPDGSLAGYVGLVLDDDEGGGAAARLLRGPGKLVESLIELSPEVITVLDEDGTWRYSNGAAWRMLGYQVNFEPTDGIIQLIHPEDLPIAAQMMRELRSGAVDQTEPVELRVRAGDGSWRYIEVVGERHLDDPVIHGFLVRSRDVTERREARLALLEANQRLSTLISSLHLAVLLEDDERTIVYTNEAFVTLFEIGLSPSELVGHTVAELGPRFFRRFGDPTWDETRGRTAEILEARQEVVGDRVAMADGRVLERDYLPVVVDGLYRGHVFVFRDVSAQARAEAEWAALISRQRAENDRLVELDQAKAAFLAEISHELRTPLGAILSFTELLHDGLGRDEVTEQAEFLEIIRRNADRLLRLVDDLVLLDRIETGSMSLEWGTVDLPDVVAVSVQSFAPAAEAKSITLDCSIGSGPSIPGDEGRLAQLLDVLVSNAIKFTPEHGTVRVTARLDGDEWSLEVADSGIGVPEAEQQALFDRFYRASNARTSRIPGSGLGLAVARAIAELHGGTISLHSTEGAGTIVTVTLPATERSAGIESAGSGGRR